MSIINMRTTICFMLGCAITASAQLSVVVSPVKITGQKAMVSLAITNHLTTKVESARAACFLLDEQGEMIGQSTKWIIGQSKVGLEPKEGTTFNFVITTPQTITDTNLTAKISFTSLVLTGNKMANPMKEVVITEPPKKN